MTDGILLREMTTDFLLNDYSVIMIDEAHERKVNTDILIGLLSRVVNIRCKLAKEERLKKKGTPDDPYKYYPLRLIIMSATLRVKDFTENKYLFPKQVCVINIESRQYPLTLMFSKVTKDDYFEEALKKTVKIHNRLPPGGVLVFLTGEREIREFCIKLHERLQKKKKDVLEEEKDEDGAEPKRMAMLDLDVDLSDNEEEPEITNENPEDGENKAEGTQKAKQEVVELKPFIVPLYSKLPLHEQERIFKNLDDKSR